MLASVGQFVLISSQGYEQKNSAIIEIAEWANRETPLDSLFIIYGDWQDNEDFRLFSQRNIHHSRKDLNLIGYSHPEDLTAQYDRYIHLQSMQPSNEDELVALFQDELLDYVILKDVELADSQSYELVKQADSHMIYQCAEACK